MGYYQNPSYFKTNWNFSVKYFMLPKKSFPDKKHVFISSIVLIELHLKVTFQAYMSLKLNDLNFTFSNGLIFKNGIVSRRTVPAAAT